MSEKTTIYLHKDELNEKKKELTRDDIYFIFGDDSIYVPKFNTSYVNLDACYEWPNLDGEISLLTPGQAARIELKREFPDFRSRIRKTEFSLLDISPPMYFPGRCVRSDSMGYIDLKGAYHQIYKWLTLDIAYPRGIGSLPLWPVAQRLAEWKTARNTLVGIIRSHEITGMKHGKMLLRSTYNPYFNPGLWATIQDILHELAYLAICYGAQYVATDAYIFRTAKNYLAFKSVLEDFGFQVGEHGVGFGVIYGWGSYRIKDVKGTWRVRETNARVCNIERRETENLQWLARLRRL